LAACGFEYDGPKAHLGFVPRLTPENFKCAFTGAEGWGSFSQKAEGGGLKAEIAVRWGRLKLKTISLAVTNKAMMSTVKVMSGQKSIPAKLKVVGQRALVTLSDGIQLDANTDLRIALA
jgi:hypothetical protein